ncbi:general RNA polymerase II transcription factor [Nowakowskiella sp. JEL0407]|nr:general RNA polymerase II transcription factor [Nowakowskiella sp. JEL0407]
MSSFVVQIGSFSAKAGIADYQQKPAIIIPSAVAFNNNVPLCGKLLSTNPNPIIHPVQNGIIQDWSAFEALCKHLFVRELGISRSRNHSSLLLAVPTYWTKYELERVTQIMFEVLNIANFAVIDQSLLCLYAVAATTGLVLDIGHDKTDVVPVFENMVNKSASLSISLAGKDVEIYLAELLKSDLEFMKQFPELVPSSPQYNDVILDLARTIKESAACEVRDPSKKYSPDSVPMRFTWKGRKYVVGAPRYLCMEVLFNPALINKESLNIVDAVYVAISNTLDIDRRVYWEKIVLTGGLSQVKGIKDRIEYEGARYIASSVLANELQPKDLKFAKIPEYFSAYIEQADAPIALVSEEDNLTISLENDVPGSPSDNVKSGERPQDLAFLGACVISRNLFLDTKFSDRQLFVTRTDYNENGPSCITTN